VKVRGGDLEARAKRHHQVAMQLKPAEYRARCQERLLLAILRAVIREGVVDLELRP